MQQVKQVFFVSVSRGSANYSLQVVHPSKNITYCRKNVSDAHFLGDVNICSNLNSSTVFKIEIKCKYSFRIKYVLTNDFSLNFIFTSTELLFLWISKSFISHFFYCLLSKFFRMPIVTGGYSNLKLQRFKLGRLSCAGSKIFVVLHSIIKIGTQLKGICVFRTFLTSIFTASICS